ncbi:MAG: hypothetical protein ACTHLA_05260 [Asticcacaulis sp.]|uniref:hypothetical protein n=1 Tax=Asticcacaulis sp. TaxID=1872648 RepID=UPI003F7C3B86
MPTTPFTELEAVNEMLMSIGQAPVNSLTTAVGDVNIAHAILGVETRYVVLFGFTFNTDEAVRPPRRLRLPRLCQCAGRARWLLAYPCNVALDAMNH